MNKNVHLALVNAAEEFAKLIDSLPPGSFTDKVSSACDRVSDAHDKLLTALHNEEFNDFVRLKDAVNRLRRDRQAGQVFNDLLSQVFYAYVKKNHADMRKHWRTFNRVLEELNAPLPTKEELRAEIEREFGTVPVTS